jgi:hypothetical protein
MPTLQQILDSFDELRLKQACHCDDCETKIKSFITSTYKSIIQGEIEHFKKEINTYRSYLTQMQDKKSYDEGNLVEQLLSNQINYLQNKLNEIE